MAERRPDSLLFSLKELRRIEDDRVKQEEQTEQQRIDADLRAKEDAKRQAIEQAARQKQAAEDEVRRSQEEKERQAREEQLRLQEAERRARVEAEMKLQQQRMAMEMDAKSTARRTLQWKLFLGAVVILLVVGGGLGYWSWAKSQEADKAQQLAEKERKEKDRREKEWAEKERMFQQQQDTLNKKINELMAGLADAKDDAKRELIRKQIKAQQAALKRAKRIRVRNTNDPLGGLGL